MERVTELWAWVVRDLDGAEGILARQGSAGVVPLVGGSRQKIESHRPYAQKIANKLNERVTLRCFSQMEVVEDLRPGAVEMADQTVYIAGIPPVRKL